MRLLYPLLENQPETRALFPKPQLAAFRKGRSLSALLCRASVAHRQFDCKTCVACAAPKCQGCPLTPFLQSGSYIVSTETGLAFDVGAPVSCLSRDVVYVITCTKCNLQGVGECANPKDRIPAYTRGISRHDHSRDNLPKGAVAILQHFLHTPHSIADFHLMLVDRVPAVGLPVALRGLFRRRLELLWIAKLQAKLNKNTQWRHSFPGALDKKKPCTGRGGVVVEDGAVVVGEAKTCHLCSHVHIQCLRPRSCSVTHKKVRAPSH